MTTSTTHPETFGSTFTVVGTKRSGHHAFIEWICTNLAGSYVYLNNLPLRRDSVYVKFIERRDSGSSDDSPAQSLRYSAHKKVESQEVQGYRNILFSYENHPLESVLRSKVFDAQKRMLSDAGKGEHLIVFLRDPINTFASLLKVFERKPVDQKQLSAQRRAWIDHATCYLNASEEGMLNREKPSQHVIRVVSYNRFIRSEQYRHFISTQLGLERSLWSRELSRFGGGGNTFFEDKNSYQASVDNLEARWKSLSSLDKLKEMFKDDELYKLSVQYYQAVGLGEVFLPVLRDLRAAKTIAEG